MSTVLGRHDHIVSIVLKSDCIKIEKNTIWQVTFKSYCDLWVTGWKVSKLVNSIYIGRGGPPLAPGPTEWNLLYTMYIEKEKKMFDIKSGNKKTYPIKTRF